jgi:hypothetical protein
MSRSGYTEDCDDQWALIRWRGAVNAGIKGKRGQAMLRELLAALDAMPDKRLVANSLVSEDGEFCTLGVLGKARGVDLETLDPDDRETVAHTFGISVAMAAEIMWENDEAIGGWRWVEYELCGPVRPRYPDWGSHRIRRSVLDETAPERRWRYMRDWVASHISAEA